METTVELHFREETIIQALWKDGWLEDEIEHKLGAPPDRIFGEEVTNPQYGEVVVEVTVELPDGGWSDE